jgi:hypothetical protein
MGLRPCQYLRAVASPITAAGAAHCCPVPEGSGRTIAGNGKDVIVRRAHVAEDVVACFPIREVGRRSGVIRAAEAGTLFPYVHQSRLILELQRSQQNSIRQAEHRTVPPMPKASESTAATAKLGCFNIFRDLTVRNHTLLWPLALLLIALSEPGTQ